jgi:hypothetical protein
MRLRYIEMGTTLANPIHSSPPPVDKICSPKMPPTRKNKSIVMIDREYSHEEHLRTIFILLFWIKCEPSQRMMSTINGIKITLITGISGSGLYAKDG